MMSGFDRYYQIVKCFRDEDLRADRQPEFTQIDVETSFLTAPEVREIMERMVHGLWQNIIGVDLGKFPQMTWQEAMTRFGSDKPDLRNPLELVDVADIVKDVEFKVFNEPANNPNGRVAVIRVPMVLKSLVNKLMNIHNLLVFMVQKVWLGAKVK